MCLAETAEFNELLQAVGQAITDWAAVEEGLFQVFFRGLACPALGPPACAFIAADNVRAKIAMVDSIIRHSSLTEPLRSQWDALRKRCEAARKQRNDIAHRKATLLQIGKSKIKAVLTIYAHDVRLHLKGEPHKLLRIPIEHVKEMSIKFRALGVDLQKFATQIPQPPA